MYPFYTHARLIDRYDDEDVLFQVVVDNWVVDVRK